MFRQNATRQTIVDKVPRPVDLPSRLLQGPDFIRPAANTDPSRSECMLCVLNLHMASAAVVKNFMGPKNVQEKGYHVTRRRTAAPLTENLTTTASIMTWSQVKKYVQPDHGSLGVSV